MMAAFPALSRRFGPLGLIVLLHVGFFYVLARGLPSKTAQVQAQPKEVFATLIRPAPQPVPEVPKPPKAKPKTVPVVKKHIPAPVPPVIKTKPAPAAITEPAPPPSPPAPPSPEPPAPAIAAAPPAPAQPGPPKTVSSVEYLQPPRPAYPAMSRRLGEEGKAVLHVLVNERGRAERVELQVSTGSPRLDEAARQAILRAVFKPSLENGKAVAVYVTIPIKFQLD